MSLYHDLIILAILVRLQMIWLRLSLSRQFVIGGLMLQVIRGEIQILGWPTVTVGTLSHSFLAYVIRVKKLRPRRIGCPWWLNMRLKLVIL